MGGKTDEEHHQDDKLRNPELKNQLQIIIEQ